MTSTVLQCSETSRVLVVGVYRLDEPTRAVEITKALRSTPTHDVEISWGAVGNQTVPDALEAVTRVVVAERPEKFVLVNQLLSRHKLSSYDVLLVTEDDVEIEPGWLDAFLSLQADTDLALCQPARDPESWIDHPITIQLLGVGARLTNFVEVGPLFSVHRTAFDYLVPFDESQPLERGFDRRQRALIGQAGLHMGIIDGAPVFRPQPSFPADKSPGDPPDTTAIAVDPNPGLERDSIPRVIATRVGDRWATTEDRGHGDPRISVVLSTRDRNDLLIKALGGLVAQSLDRGTFEVVVIDDGDSDEAREIADRFAGLLAIRYERQEPSGVASARNHGLFLSRGDIVIFLDDDDVADTSLLETHLGAHRRFPGPNVAILGYTDLAVDVASSFLMRHITGLAGQQLFSYESMTDQQVLAFTDFWGGRVSVKRSWLMAHEVFDPRFLFGYEDVELGYRLNRHGLVVRFEARARSTMIRKMTLRGFLQRATKLGGGMARAFSIHHDAALIKPIAAIGHEPLRWSDPAFVEALTAHTESLLDLADDALICGVTLDSAVVEEIGGCINYLHCLHLAGGYRRYMLGMA